MKKNVSLILSLATVCALVGQVAVAGPSDRAAAALTIPQHQIRLSIDPMTSIVRILPSSSRDVINGDLTFVSANCTNCAGAADCASTPGRSVDVVLRANGSVSAGYGISDLVTTNYTYTGASYSPAQTPLVLNELLTITLTGDVINCEGEFKLFFDMCSNPSGDAAAACPAWGTVFNPTTGETWMDRNLGASQVAISSNDAAAYGDLYQWGRASEGHESRAAGSTTINATTAVPNLGNPWDGLYIYGSASPWDWLTPQDNTLWQGVGGTNNPCPSGFRLPTEAEWEAERLSWSSNNAAGAFASPLKLTIAGFRLPGSGALVDVGIQGRYWSSTVVGVQGRRILFYGPGAFTNDDNRDHGFSVRCIQD